MGVNDSSETGVSGGQIALLGILLVAILWRVVISLDGKITFWESLCSGIPLILLGWVLFGYCYRHTRGLKGWIISNYIYQGIAICLVVVNSYVLIYYGMRWYRLLAVEAYLPLDFIFRDIRYITLVTFYCSVIWSAKYVKKMHEEYISRAKRKTVQQLMSPNLHHRSTKLSEMELADIVMDERTLIVIIGLTFLWRIFISLDYEISIWESLISGIAVILLGWIVFAHLYFLFSKQRNWLDLLKVYHATALGVIAMNLYTLVYYGMRWYRLAGSEEAFVPWDFLFRDVRYFILVMFYCASLVLSTFLKRAYVEYTILSTGKP
ncbi:MAG TPA: hypothetical protein ENN68_04240 [Methanomicrobia archaeon]|nr:hypothetical protein [Methanomicrobia archaeon]